MNLRTLIYTSVLIILMGCADDLDVLKAVCSNDKAAVEKYLNGDFDVNRAYAYNDGEEAIKLLYVALDYEICDADDEMVKLIMHSGYKIKNVHAALLSSYNGSPYLFKYLLSTGVNINLHTKEDGTTILNMVGKKGSYNNGEEAKAAYLRSIKDLMENLGADPELNPNGKRSFIERVEQGDYRITGLVTYLRSLGYNLNLNDKAKEYYKDELNEAVE